MALFPLATEYNDREGTPSQSLTNMFAEATPQGPRPFSLRPRNGLVLQEQVGAGPIWLIVQVSATQTYVLSGSEVYLNGALIGNVASGAYRQSAFSEEQLVIVSGGSAYVVEYTTAPAVVTLIADADLPAVSGVAYLSGRFIYPNLDSSQFHYSAINDATSIAGLDFANAESDPDPIVRAETLGDQLVLSGSDSFEFWSPTNDPDAPFQRATGQTQDKGCLAPYSVIKIDNGLYWIGQDQGSGRMVFRTDGGVPSRVSTHSIEAALQEAPGGVENIQSTAFSYVGQGHTFYVINIPTSGSFALDLSTNKWAPWTSFGQSMFKVRAGSGRYFGDADGNVFAFDEEAKTDNGDPIVRVVSCFIPLERRTKCNVICLEGATGVSNISGTGSDAVVEMRFTDNLTGDFSDWQPAPLGLLGERSARVAWWQLGTALPPGRLFEFRYSEPVLSVPYGVSMNVRP